MTCPFQRCAVDVVHCDGACHGVTPDGLPASAEYMTSLERVKPDPNDGEMFLLWLDLGMPKA